MDTLLVSTGEVMRVLSKVFSGRLRDLIRASSSLQLSETSFLRDLLLAMTDVFDLTS